MEAMSVGTADVTSDQWALRPPGVLAPVLRPIVSRREALPFTCASS
jgi:hypothetical protein